MDSNHHSPPCQEGALPLDHRIMSGPLVRPSAPARIRTWTATFEAWNDIRFTTRAFRKQPVPWPGIEPGSPPSEGGVVIRWTTRANQRKERDSNPQTLAGAGLAGQCDTNSAHPSVSQPSVDPPGIEPGLPACRASVIPLDHRPIEPSPTSGAAGS